MSYRYYFKAYDKEFISKIKDCKTTKEFNDLVLKFYPNVEIETEENGNLYIPTYQIPSKKIFEFGSGYDNADEIINSGQIAFSSKELLKQYEGYDFIICDENAILLAIEYCRLQVIAEYEDLLREKSKYSWNRSDQLDRAKVYFNEKLNEWNNEIVPELKPYDLNKENDNIVRSWLYEYEVFELVRIYKNFDWGNNSLIFMGW